LNTAGHQIVMRFFEGLGAGMLSDDLFTADMTVWTVSSGAADKARFLAGARLLASLFNGTLAYTVDSLTAQDDRIAVEAQSRGTLANGESYHNTHMYLFSIRDGRIAALSEYMNQTLIKERIVPLIQAAMSRGKA
jgi:ketosteroid isomerase-like protein